MNDPANTRSTPAEADQIISLRLRDIACWHLPELAQKCDQGKPIKPPILPGLPSLQRGAVWKPNQIELLWDSVLRGFPIGSMVVCKLLDNQATRAGVVADAADRLPWPDDYYTHHLLDGQQRANALALGYLDPFLADPVGRGPDTLLWLDLDPTAEKSSRLPPSSSRWFLLRVTTVAHPWGFKVSDGNDPQRLEHQHAKDAREAFNKIHEVGELERHRPRDGWPYEANVPIPMAWALEAVHKVDADMQDSPANGRSELDLWVAIQRRCKEFIDGRPELQTGLDTIKDNSRRFDGKFCWALRAKCLLDEWCSAVPDKLPTQAVKLAKALKRTARTQIVALTVPEDALTERSQAKVSPGAADETDNSQDISNVEHLFQRLNGGGTTLDGDELRFSMIKAYWPGIESTISAIQVRPPDTQVALLGARLALDPGDVLPAAPTVETLRRLATVDPGRSSNPPKDNDPNNKRREDCSRIKDFFDLSTVDTVDTVDTAGTDSSQAKPVPPVAQAFKKLDDWFLYRSEQTWGLPQVLRSRMAEQAPEVFLFLLRLAKAHVGATPDEDIRRKLLGLATALHWFGKDRAAGVRELWKVDPKEWLDGTAFTSNLPWLIQLQNVPTKNPETMVKSVARILTDNDLEKFIEENTFAQDTIEKWNWWQMLVVAPAKRELDPNANPKEQEKAINERWAKYGDFIQVLNRGDYRGTNALLLMYAQREQMQHRFSSYDPSRVGYWELHNTPWDFDHILPQNAFTKLKTPNNYMSCCKEWGFTIANLHIWPFEKNRSRHDDIATGSLPGDEDELRRMLLLDHGDRRQCFSLDRGHVGGQKQDSQQKVYEFLCAARSRMLRIYRDWYETLKIQDLL